MTEAPIPSPTPPLEIAHVLFMDIVAYSTLHMDRQQQLLHELQEAVRSTPTFFHAQAQEQLIRLPTGDGMALVFFQHPEAPVRCALELAKALCGNPDLKLRMGIHTGPVYRVADINANRNVAGGGINIAQRVMDCGDAGHILVSSAEAEVLGQVSVWCSMLHDLGEVEVKHGLRIHLYNLYSEEAGSPAVPKKISAQRAASSLVASDVKKRKFSPVMIAGLTSLAILGGWLFYAHKAHALSSTDTIVLADFTNKTGDAIFDDTLRQGLAVQLEQSPFLSLIGDERIQQNLGLMGYPPDARLTSQIARDLCQRTGSKAYIAGSIASLGTNFVVGLNVVNCVTGDSLAHEQVEARGKEKVLDALARSTTKLREKLGESLSTVKKYDTPLEQATTPSLEALKAYTLALRTWYTKGDGPSIPAYKRAIEIDPNFALAYSALGTSYGSLGEDGLAKDNFSKAYELRDRTSDREKYQVSGGYYSWVTGELDKANEVYEQWAQTYPRDFFPFFQLGVRYFLIGQYEKALSQTQESVSLNGDAVNNYCFLIAEYHALNRVSDAETTYEKALARNLENPYLHADRYASAFLERDFVEMQRQVGAAKEKPVVEDLLLSTHSDTEAYFGRLAKARAFSRLAAEVAERNDQKGTAAQWLLNAALREAEIGNPAQVQEFVTTALVRTSSRDMQTLAALALARAGYARAQTIADDLSRKFPTNSLLNSYWLATIRAALELNRNHPDKAIQLLRPALAYELGQPYPEAQIGGTLYPVYVRGEAYLRARLGQQAAVEFQKIIDHRGVLANFVLGALAHLGLARAYTLQGDTAEARTKYQDFLTLWKDADTDIPILKQARAEYAKLQ